MIRGGQRSWAADLCHPVPLASLAALLVNDHVLKGAGILPASVTGKLSDIAGLLVFPVLLVTLGRGLQVATRLSMSDRHLIHGSVVTTVIGFAALKLSVSVNLVAASLWGVNVMDSSDLYALPACAVAWLLLLDRANTNTTPTPTEQPLRWHHATVVAVAAFASIATPAPRSPRNFPAWRVVTNTPTTLGCAQLHARVAKSGKTGVGLFIQQRQLGTATCAVAITRARLTVRGIYKGDPHRDPTLILHGGSKIGSVTKHTYRGTLPAVGTLPAAGAASAPPSGTTLYIAFAFDNNHAWNNNRRSGTFELDVQVDGTTHTWKLPAVHERDGYHTTIPRSSRLKPTWRK